MANASLWMGIAGVILSTLGWIFTGASWLAYIGLALGAIGLIISIMALRHHKREGKLGNRAVWGMILSIIAIIEWVIVLIITLPKGQA